MKSAEQRLAAALELISHKPTRGTLAEEVLREIIDAFLPGQWSSHSGFVLGADQTPTRQIDIIVYDQLSSSPLYRDANVVVLPTGTRPIVIEVKSVLNKDALFDALENVASVKSMEPRPREVAAMIYAFQGFKKSTTLQTHLQSHVNALKRKKGFDPELLPDMICVQEEKMVVIRDREPAFGLIARSSKDPVVQSLLTQLLIGLRLPNLYSMLPEPGYKKGKLFEIR